MEDWSIPAIDWVLFAPCGGVVLHEVFRLYQGIWRLEVLAPLGRPIWYLIILSVFCLFATLLANAFQIAEVIGRLSFGFTFVTFLGGLAPRPQKTATDQTDDHFEQDSQERTKPVSLQRVIGDFFWYRWG